MGGLRMGKGELRERLTPYDDISLYLLTIFPLWCRGLLLPDLYLLSTRGFPDLNPEQNLHRVLIKIDYYQLFTTGLSAALSAVQCTVRFVQYIQYIFFSAVGSPPSS